MLTLLYGTDASASREALLSLKQQYPAEVVTTLSAEGINEEDFFSTTRTSSMFAEKRLVVIEGKISKITGIINPENLGDLSKPESLTDVIFWTDEELRSTSPILKTTQAMGGRVQLFREKIPQSVFNFLDLLGARKSSLSLLELHRLLDSGESPVYLVTMIAWQLRNLLLAFYNETAVLNPFVGRKAKSYANNFSEAELIELYTKGCLLAERQLKRSSLDSQLVLDRLVFAITRSNV